MTCNQCGRYMPDNSRFCPGCGASVQTAAPATNIQPAYQSTPQYTVPVNTIIPDSPRLVALKKVARSPMMLIAALVFTASLVLNVLSSISISSQMTAFLDAFMKMAGEEELGMSVSASMGSSVVGAISGALPMILTALGLWITYFSAFKKNGMSTTGLTIIKVLQIISLVGVCVGGGIFLLVMVLAIVGTSVAGNQVGGAVEGMQDAASAAASGVVTTMIVVTVIIAVIFGFVVFYMARIIGSINAASQVITNGRTTKKVSVFVAVLLIIGAVGSALGSISYLGMDVLVQQLLAEMVDAGELPGETVQLMSGINFASMALPQILTAVATFLFGLLIFSYKSNVQEMLVAPPAPAYAHEVYQPVPVVPVVAEPVAKEPVVEEPVAEEPSVEEPVAEEPSVEEPVAEELAVEESVAEESAVEEPVAEETAAEEPTVEEASAEAPVVEEPVLPAFAFCCECGQKLLPTAKFCSNCGHPQ